MDYRPIANEQDYMQLTYYEITYYEITYYAINISEAALLFAESLDALLCVFYIANAATS